MTRPAAHIARMGAYQLAQMAAPPGLPLISLAQNESLRPPSPKAIAAGAEALGQGALYPDPDWTDLRHALATHHRLDAAQILCGAGSLDLIGALARVYAGPERAVLTLAHAYPFFGSAAAMAGARCDVAAGRRVQDLLAAVRPDTGLVFVDTPGNPTGTVLEAAALTELRQALRDDILLVVDAAYGEFGGAPMATGLGGNTVLLRTFSKAYGLAGHRVGWGVFPLTIAGEVRKVLNPNNISLVSQAVARAALTDDAYMRETCALTATAREAAAARLTEVGFTVSSGPTNFLLIDLGTAERAAVADAALQAQGLFLRRQAGAGLPHMLRLTIGPPDAMDAALSALITLQTGEPT